MLREETGRPSPGRGPGPRRSTQAPLPSPTFFDGDRRPVGRLFSAWLRLDAGTRMHLKRVGAAARELAAAAGLPPSAQRHAALAGLLHDIGKSDVPISILRKPAPLTPSESTVLSLHTVHGPELAAGIADPVVLDAIRHHHEWLDGTGYPDGLEGDAIGPEARVVAVADMYDALTSDRPYRAALPDGEALQHLCDVAGRKLDPALVDALLALRLDRVVRAA